MKKYKALTLIELLIASSIFVVVIVTIYSAFHSGIFGYRNIEETIDTYQAARSILGRINLDLRNSLVYKDDDTKFSGSQNEICFLTLVDKFGQDRLLQELAFLSYKLEKDKLMRLCRKNQEALKENSEIQPEEMADNVEIKFEYGYKPQGKDEIEFKTSWPSPDIPDGQKLLPVAVKVNLTVKEKGEQKFERTIYLPLAE